MILREFRGSDLPQLIALQRDGFPEENALYGIRPEELGPIVRRLERPTVRLLLGLMRTVGRPPFLFPVVEEDGKVVATTVLSFGPRIGYVSMVMVDSAFRRRGYARRLLEVCGTATRRRGKPYLALDVLSANGPARALYDSLGYRPLRSVSVLVRDVASDGPAAGPGSPVRPFVKRDARPLISIATPQVPAAVAEVFPPERSALSGGGWSSRMFARDTASWVVDAGRGPEAFLSATITPVTEAAHLSPPIVGPGVAPDRADALITTALAWVRARSAPRAVVLLPEENRLGRELLERAGFTDALSIVTLYRPAA